VSIDWGDDIYYDNFQNGSGTGSIDSVNIKMRADVSGLSDDYITIRWYVNGVQGTGTYQINSGNQGSNIIISFEDVTEPQDGTWTWTDLQNLEIRTDGTKIGGADSINFYIDEIWAIVTELDEIGPDEDQWFSENIDLDDYLGLADFKIRFRAKVNDTNADGNVDNVKIVGS